MPEGALLRSWYALYNLLLHLGALLLLPYWLFVRFARGRYRGQFRERMGIFSPDTLAPFQGRRAVWIHAASAGETVSASGLVRLLRAALPGHPFLFTVTSRYGLEMAKRQLAGQVDAITFSPLDLPLFCRRFDNRIHPMLYVMVETDLWPNLVRLLRRRGVPSAVASGHAGPRSFPRSFWAAVLSRVDLFLMQTASDAANLGGRGAPAGRIKVCGNLKFDGSGVRLPEEEIPALRARLGLAPGSPLLVAGSTLAEDEAPLLEAITALRSRGIGLHAVIAPRRQERAEALVAGAAARGLKAVRRTQGGSGDLLVLDTMGELASAYNLASVAYVGGGLTPEVGLHNLLEPLVCGVPVVFGPHHGKAARIAAEFLRLGAGVQIDGPGGLAPALESLLADEGHRNRLASAGEELLALHRGAAERCAREILALLP